MNMNPLKQVGLRVFYNILKVHHQRLPLELRSLGDAYVKEEFKQAHLNANQEQYIEFITRWIEYMQEIDKNIIGRNLSEEEQSFLNEEQKKNLETIRDSSKQK